MKILENQFNFRKYTKKSSTDCLISFFGCQIIKMESHNATFNKQLKKLFKLKRYTNLINLKVNLIKIP